MGIVSPLGIGISETKDALKKNLSAIRPITLFSTSKNRPLPVGEVQGFIQDKSIPRTHAFARIAAAEAMADLREPPDAIVVGITTGGMLTTEFLLKRKEQDPALFRYHSPSSVGEDLASRYHVTGPVICVSTACSSGAVAIKIALEMLRSGLARRVLAGGTDSLCRLTYYGFNSLQLIDPLGARPLDKDRLGMSVAEGAAMVLLAADEPEHAVAEIAGAGLSCDAYHPTAPHPEGKGALEAMQAALLDAGISPPDIDYINLHGTGTLDNDLSEARAIKALFKDKTCYLSSVKGAFGHSLAAAGAIEAVVSALSISDRLIPANTGCRICDPALMLDPIMQPKEARVSAVLSNSFGFGGNNASIVIGALNKFPSPIQNIKKGPLRILSGSCITGAGSTKNTMEALYDGRHCQGLPSDEKISENLSPAKIRRLKRLPRLALSLAVTAQEASQRPDTPSAVFFSTGWGALSETFNFLKRLEETEEQYPSPTDFVGSVHNAPAGQIAMMFDSTAANVTTTGGDYSFEQALMTAGLLAEDNGKTFIVIGADEFHQGLSRLLDASVLRGQCPSDGGGALCLTRGSEDRGLSIQLAFYESSEDNPRVISSLVQVLGGIERINRDYGVILAGIPGALKEKATDQLKTFLSLTGFKGPAIDYRRQTGEFASASAVAAVMAVKFLERGEIPGALFNGKDFLLHKKGALVLGLGNFVTAMEVRET